MLFICGMHQIALSVSKRYCQSAFYSLYSDYIEKYKGKGVPREFVNQYFRNVIDNKNILNISDSQNFNQSDVFKKTD